MESKHVLFLTYHLPLGSEPGAFRPWMEARLLAKAGYRVTVVTSGVQYMTGEDIRPYKAWCTEEFIDGIQILRTWAPKDHRRSLFKRTLNYLSYTILAGLASIFKVGKVNRIFAATDPIFTMPMVYLISWLKNGDLILDERDLYPETAVALGVIKEGALSQCLFQMQQFFRRKATALLAATPGIQESLMGYGHLPQKVFLLYNADIFIDEDLNQDAKQRSLDEQPNKLFILGYAGALGKANDIPTLLRAAGRLCDLDKLAIVIIGSGERRREYETYCAEKSLANVFFFDAVPRHKVRQLIQQFDMCVHLYPDVELFKGALASKIFDYHGSGKPMIFCGQGDTVRLLQETEGGLAVPSGDDKALSEAIRRLLKDSSLRERMGNSAREWYEKNIGTEAGCALMKKAMESHAF